MRIRRILVPLSGTLALALVLAVPPAHAAPRPQPQDAGIRNLLRYASCAISIVLARDGLSLASSFTNCARLLLDEQERDTNR